MENNAKLQFQKDIWKAGICDTSRVDDRDIWPDREVLGHAKEQQVFTGQGWGWSWGRPEQSEKKVPDAKQESSSFLEG